MVTVDCSNTPLSAFVADGMLQIRIGVNRLAFDDVERLQIKVTDATGFAEDVARALTKEREDGSSSIYDCLDAAQFTARDDGSVNILHPSE
jgi:hypothetical protein